MPGKERSLVSGSSEAKRESSAEELQVKKDDDDDVLLTLSLGPIRSGDHPAAVAGPRRAAALLADDCSPVTPTLPAPLRPANAAIASYAAVADIPPPPPSFALGLATATAVHGGAYLAAGVPTAPTLPLFQPHFPSGGGGNAAFAVPVHHGGALTPSRTPIDGALGPPQATSPSMQGIPAAPPRKRRRVINRTKPASNAASLINNGGLVAEHPAPFPWAKPNRVAEHYSLAELAERGIATVEGEVQCRRCDARATLSLDVASKFGDLRDFIARNVQAMNDRAPEEWKDPALPDCGACGQKSSLRPVIAAEKERINWVFLLLGQTLGLCTLEQLKHFCAHTNQHRTGAKDRVLYSTYMELCNQLCPGGPFDMASERKNRIRTFV